MAISLRFTQRGAPGLIHTLEFSLSPGYRIGVGAVAIALVIAAAAAASAPAWIFPALAALGALYEERWTFDLGAGELRSRIGLVFLARRRRYAFASIMGVGVERFVKGALDQSVSIEPDKLPRGSEARLLIELKDGSRLIVDAMPYRDRERLTEAAERIAALAGLPLLAG